MVTPADWRPRASRGTLAFDNAAQSSPQITATKTLIGSARRSLAYFLTKRYRNNGVKMQFFPILLKQLRKTP